MTELEKHPSSAQKWDLVSVLQLKFFINVYIATKWTKILSHFFFFLKLFSTISYPNSIEYFVNLDIYFISISAF